MPREDEGSPLRVGSSSSPLSPDTRGFLSRGLFSLYLVRGREEGESIDVDAGVLGAKRGGRGKVVGAAC